MKRCSKKLYEIFILCLFLTLSFNFKTIAYSKELIPYGKTMGVTVKIAGVYVIDTDEFEDIDGKSVSPARDAGIMSGDIIKKIDDKNILSSEDMSCINNINKSDISVIVLRNGEEKNFDVSLKKSKEGVSKLGIWVKEYESGIGTITYIEPETRKFGALGHGICQRENIITDINGGKVLSVDLTSVKKGERGAPGELIGIFPDREIIFGEVKQNSKTGVFGLVNDEFLNSVSTKPVEVLPREDVVEGDASVLSNIEGDDVLEYSAKITRINNDETNSKGMIVKITDKELLNKTGGIVQGMSGSPIIQNGKLVGAITHVFVNDPTRGYGIFIENMLAEAEKIK